MQCRRTFAIEHVRSGARLRVRHQCRVADQGRDREPGGARDDAARTIAYARARPSAQLRVDRVGSASHVDTELLTAATGIARASRTAAQDSRSRRWSPAKFSCCSQASPRRSGAIQAGQARALAVLSGVARCVAAGADHPQRSGHRRARRAHLARPGRTGRNSPAIVASLNRGRQGGSRILRWAPGSEQRASGRSAARRKRSPRRSGPTSNAGVRSCAGSACNPRRPPPCGGAGTLTATPESPWYRSGGFEARPPRGHVMTPRRRPSLHCGHAVRGRGSPVLAEYARIRARRAPIAIHNGGQAADRCRRELSGVARRDPRRAEVDPVRDVHPRRRRHGPRVRRRARRARARRHYRQGAG